MTDTEANVFVAHLMGHLDATDVSVTYWDGEVVSGIVTNATLDGPEVELCRHGVMRDQHARIWLDFDTVRAARVTYRNGTLLTFP